MTSILFYPGPTYSYVYSLFSNGFDWHFYLLDMLIHVCPFVGEFVLIEKVYRHFFLLFGDKNIRRFDYFLDD